MCVRVCWRTLAAVSLVARIGTMLALAWIESSVSAALNVFLDLSIPTWETVPRS